MRFLVTAGPTQEKIDSVRQWSNVFTGSTGLAITSALASIGEVDLLTSNQSHLAQVNHPGSVNPKIRATEFHSHADLRHLLAERMQQNRYQAVFMTAAVADYQPTGVFAVLSRQPSDVVGREMWIVQDVGAPKVKSAYDAIAVTAERTEKLIDLFRREWNYRGLLVKFKLEVGISREELIRVGQASRVNSGAEYLVANTLDMVNGADAGAYLLSDQGAEWVSRSALPARMVQIAESAAAQ